MIYFLHIGYRGSNFSGWQFQLDNRTVQGVIEDCFAQIFKEKITVHGCGRTDTGVHASQYVFHIEIDLAFSFDLKFILNKKLPDEIVIFDIWEMQDDKHARYDAISRTYDYFIHLDSDPMLNYCSSFYDIDTLDIVSMSKVVSILPDYQDFKTVCKQSHLYKHTLCNITEAKLYYCESQRRLRFSITADRFMRGMVRLIVSVLLKVGTGKMTSEAFEEQLANQQDLKEKSSALPQGLYLSKIEYPYLKIPQRNDICSFLKEGLKEVLD